MIVNSKIMGPFGTLVAADFFVAYSSIYVAALVRFHGDWDAVFWNVGILWYRALIFAAATVITLFCFGLLRTKHRDRFLRTAANAAAAVIVAACTTALISYAVPQTHTGRGILAMASLFTFAGAVSLRYVFNRVVDEGYFKRNILVIGAGRAAATIENRMRRKTDRRSFNVVGYVPASAQEPMVPSRFLVSIDPGEIVDFSRTNNIDEIVVAMEERRNMLPTSELLSLRLSGIEVTDILDFWENECGRLKLDVLMPSSLIFGDGFSASTWSRVQKRALDLSIAAILGIVLAPLMLLIALAIWTESGFKQPVLYRQVRIGFRGQPFHILKFRSMRVDAEADGHARWATDHDPRVTRVGKFIRAARLDELPQLYNIATGQMSFVGPRPERPEFVEELNKIIPYYDERHLAKPGVTGWAQLVYPYGATVEDAKEKLQFDLYYLKHHSLLFDLTIILRTVEVVFTGNGAR